MLLLDIHLRPFSLLSLNLIASASLMLYDMIGSLVLNTCVELVRIRAARTAAGGGDDDDGGGGFVFVDSARTWS